MRKRVKRYGWNVVVALSIGLGTWTSVSAQSLTWLGTLSGAQSWVSGVSADGSVVVGGSYNASGQTRAFRWTESGGMQELGTLPGYDWWSGASCVSVDGAVVVGVAKTASN